MLKIKTRTTSPRKNRYPMAASNSHSQATLGLASFLAANTHKYRSLSDGRRTYLNVHKATDILIMAEFFLNSNNIRSGRMRQRDLAMAECNKLVRSRILVLADTSQYRSLARNPNCLVFIRMQPKIGSSSRRRH